MKLRDVLLVTSLVLIVSGGVEAIDLEMGPLGFKTFNWEVSRGYDGTIGKTYFHDAGTPGYDPVNPNHLLFSDVSFSSLPTGPGLQPGEDLYGLLDVTQLWDGTVTGGGTDIARGNKYWDKGDNGEYLRGMFWNGQDKRVFFADNGMGGKLVTVYATDVQYNLYEMPTDYLTGGPQVNPLLDPSNRDGTDYFTNWRGDDEGVLVASGQSSFFRFLGETAIGSINGQSIVYLDVEDGAWAPMLDDFWTIPASIDGLFDDTATTEFKQTWTILDESGPWVKIKQTWTILDESGPWVKSEDVGKGFVIPEPTAMCLLSVSALALLRRRRVRS